jgi:hypothetical protein
MYVYQCGSCRYCWLDYREPVQSGQFGVDPFGRPVPLWYFPPCPRCFNSVVSFHGQYHPQPPTMPALATPMTTPPLLTNSASPSVQDKGLKPDAKVFVPQSAQKPSTQQLTVAQPKTAPVKLSDPFEVLPAEVLELVHRQLDRKALKFVCLVSKRWRTFGVEFLRLFVPRLHAHGSAVSTIQPIILRELESTKNLLLAIDKVPYSSYHEGSILEYILNKGIQVELLLGTRDDRTLKLLNRARRNAARAIQDLHQHQIFSKMHNKIWVLDEDGVITGSPNISWTAMNSNVESMIVIRNKDAAGLFTRYIKLLKSGTPTSGPEFQSLQQALVQYNREDRGLKLAMAPLINITDFVIEQLQGATKIVIRQFLISPTEPGSGPDVLEVLCNMARAKVDIEVYLDENQYNTQGFVVLAVNALVGSGCKVYLQSLVKVVDANNENCVHDKLILAEVHGGIRQTLIGSAGFTTEVIANRNAENFICTDSKKVYEDLMNHHRSVVSRPENVRVTQVVAKGQMPVWVKQKFTQKWLEEFK